MIVETTWLDGETTWFEGRTTCCEGETVPVKEKTSCLEGETRGLKVRLPDWIIVRLPGLKVRLFQLGWQCPKSCSPAPSGSVSL